MDPKLENLTPEEGKKALDCAFELEIKRLNNLLEETSRATAEKEKSLQEAYQRYEMLQIESAENKDAGNKINEETKELIRDLEREIHAGQQTAKSLEKELEEVVVKSLKTIDQMKPPEDVSLN